MPAEMDGKNLQPSPQAVLSIRVIILFTDDERKEHCSELGEVTNYSRGVRGIEKKSGNKLLISSFVRNFPSPTFPPSICCICMCLVADNEDISFFSWRPWGLLSYGFKNKNGCQSRQSRKREGKGASLFVYWDLFQASHASFGSRLLWWLWRRK